MPRRNHSRPRPVLATELREFTPNRTAKHVAAVLGRWPQVVRNMAKRYGLPLAVERKRAPQRQRAKA